MKNINIDKEMELFLEAACGVGQNPEDTGCEPAGASKPKSKPKIKVPKIKMPKFKIKAPTISPEKLEKRRKEVERARNRPDRKPNVVDGVDVIRDKEDEKHFIDDFLLKGDGGVDKEEYDGKMRDQWEEQQKKRTPAERKQIKKDIASWKQLGGFEAQERAVEDGTHTREEIQERNERISEVSHTTITKVDRPIERGISVPNDVAEQILADFEDGEMVEIPDESGHGSSGFSTSAETARSFAGVDDDNPEQTSIVFRIEPNSNGEVRGAFIDGEPDKYREGGYWGEGEITRSSKSKAKVRKVERVRLPNGKMVITVILTEPDDLSEVVVREEKGKVNMISRKYLEGPLNPKPQKVKKKIKKESNSLVAELVNPILKEHKLPLIESKIKKVVGIYGGRYQPFGPHHLKTYKWLKSKVDDAYITTSDIKKPPKHPMNYREKLRHMTKMGVPKNRIIKEKVPLVANNVLKKYDSETTAVIYIFGAKDAGRLAGGKKKSGGLSYFQDYKKNKNNLKGYEEHGYYMVAPHQSVRVGGKEVSGTVMRELLGSPKIDDKERPKLFKQAFGYFDKGIYQMMTNKFRKLFEIKENLITEKLVAARNKGHLKNGGKTALSTSGIISKFKGRGDISDAFSFAMKDLERAIGSLSVKQREKIFKNGRAWMNLEVMWPKSSNVINYDKAEIVFHGAIEYDDNGNAIGEVKDSARMLAGMIKQVNQNIQKRYKIGKPNFLTVPKHQNFEKRKKYFFSKLNRLQKQYGLKDNDSLSVYHQSYWEEFIFNAAKQHGFTIPKTPLKNLTKRWAFFDKSYKIPMIKKDFKNHPEFLDWVLTTDKVDHSKMVKKNMKPFEELFFEVGAEIMTNVSGWLAANPDSTVQRVKKQLDSAIKNVRAGGDLKKLNTLKLQLDKLNKIGGLKAIVPSEGIVFKYNGKTYKFTGAFAPINQITGLMTF
jgi:hypothetical protein